MPSPGTIGGAIWAVTGNNSKSFKEGTPGLHKYDATTGQLLEIVDFAPGSSIRMAWPCTMES